MLTTMEQRTITPEGCVAAPLNSQTLAPSYGTSADFMLFIVNKTFNTSFCDHFSGQDLVDFHGRNNHRIYMTTSSEK